MLGKLKFWSVLTGAGAAAAIAVLALAGCLKDTGATVERPSYVATIPPLAAILREVVGERGEVISLLQPGASPHTYDPRPSDVKAVEGAMGFFYAQKNLDAWALSFQQTNAVEAFELVPEKLRRTMTAHEHGGHGEDAADGHFWTSPLTVRAMLPELAARLSELDPEGAVAYEANAERFAAELTALNDEVSAMLKPYASEHLLLVHPSFLYFMSDYGLELAGAVEPSPGKEPTPKSLARLIEVARERDVKAIFTEPQLPKGPVRVLAEETGLPIYVLDPLGGAPGRETYAELIRYNAKILVKAFSD